MVLLIALSFLRFLGTTITLDYIKIGALKRSPAAEMTVFMAYGFSFQASTLRPTSTGLRL